MGISRRNVATTPLAGGKGSIEVITRLSLS